MHRHWFKCIVTALFVLGGFCGSVSAEQTTLDDLYQELAQADAETFARIEQRLITQWEKSESPAMDLLLRRGKDALATGTADVAVEHFSALVDHAPDFAEGYYGRTSSYYMLGLVGPALSDLEKTLALNPRHFIAIGGLGAIMESLNRPEDALELYLAVLDLNPNSVEVQNAVDRLKRQLEGQAL